MSKKKYESYDIVREDEEINIDSYRLALRLFGLSKGHASLWGVDEFGESSHIRSK